MLSVSRFRFALLAEIRRKFHFQLLVLRAIEYALEKEAWIPVISQSELANYRYRDSECTAGKAVALLRHGFGEHPLHKRGENP